jgi:uncharacterized protein YegL
MEGRKMKDNLTELIFILDRSGSMSHLVSETINGFNATIEKQKQEDGEALVTVVLFDDKYEVLHDGVDIKSIPVLTGAQYFVRGYTALLDAIGRTINTVGTRLKNTPEDERPSKVLLIITTDGQENSSHEFTQDQVRLMIEHQKTKYNWEVLFIGGDINSARYAQHDLGIADAGFSIQSVDGEHSRYTGMNAAITNYRTTGDINDGEDWKSQLKT